MGYNPRLHPNWQLLIAANGTGVERDRALLVHGPSVVSLKRLFKCDFALHPGECRTEAEVNAVTECNVQSEIAANIELIRFGIDPFVAPRRAGQ